MASLAAFTTSCLGIFAANFRCTFTITVMTVTISLLVCVLGGGGFPSPDGGTITSGDGATTSMIRVDTRRMGRHVCTLFTMFNVIVFF